MLANAPPGVRKGDDPSYSTTTPLVLVYSMTLGYPMHCVCPLNELAINPNPLELAGLVLARQNHSRLGQACLAEQRA
jgi:hypothetical protein